MKSKEKRSRKLQGGRTHGKGNTKNKRGSGNRGGVGMAGGRSHKLASTLKYFPDYYGVHGFSCPTTKRYKTLNIFQIQNLAKKGKLQQTDGKYSLEFKGKILGEGEINLPVTVHALCASNSAKEKIKKAGGELFVKKEANDGKS
ncbi:hypothetical protein AUJ17_02065 [Candidatus Micrarchaeota archaeon CG1_02_47_40]|nr:MAG: hypothetical protein AUJ17_02065 [Candidatus Micrarchaeota archaeon CG1_02_47_40]